MKSLTQRIKDYFKTHQSEWINGGKIEELAMNATRKVNGKDVHYKASNASRRLRELAEEGYLSAEEKRHPITGIMSVWYKYKTQYKTVIIHESQLVDGIWKAVAVEKEIII